MKKVNHPSPNGLKSKTEYLEMLYRNYPNVPINTIKKIERKYFNETEMCEELKKLNDRNDEP